MRPIKGFYEKNHNGLSLMGGCAASFSSPNLLIEKAGNDVTSFCSAMKLLLRRTLVRFVRY